MKTRSIIKQSPKARAARRGSRSKDSLPILGITMGDPAGIGPEVIAKAWAMRTVHRLCRPLVIGSVPVMQQTLRWLRLPFAVQPVSEQDLRAPRPGTICVLDPLKRPLGTFPQGRVSEKAGAASVSFILKAVDLAQRGIIDALVTGPINKEAINLAGYHYPGHTELLAELTGAKGSVMMLAHDGMHVSHVSTHCALEDVPKRLTPERLRRVIDVTHTALKQLGIARARIAIAALNPHAGEGGLFGRQDLDISTPVIADYVARGFDVVGPVPGDTVFVKLRGGQYDAVVAMYHDQGHIPVKLMGFKVDPATGTWNSLSGVNITLGLPIIRTSVDHGTAFDIAGQGIASETSLIEAIEYAERLAAARA